MINLNNELRNWFKNQKKWKTLKEISYQLNIPYSTLKKFFYNTNPRIPSNKHLKKLYELTNLEILKPLKGNFSTDPMLFQKIRDFNEKMNLLVEDMEWFYSNSIYSRQLLRKELKNELNYFFSLVSALSSEKAREIIIEEERIKNDEQSK